MGKIRYILATAVVLFVSQSAFAGMFVLPKAGIVFKNNGDRVGMYGIRGGFELDLGIVKPAIGVEYTYLKQNTDQNLMDLFVMIGIPILPIVHVYGIFGKFVDPSDGSLSAGIGLEGGLPLFNLIKIGGSVVYFHLKDQDDFAEVASYIAIRF